MSVKSSGMNLTLVEDMIIDWPLVIGTPTPLTLSLGTAYQASTPAKATLITINVNSVAALTLAGGTVNTADLVIGPTAAVSGGTGTLVGRYRNTLSGALIVGLAVNSDAISQMQCILPIGWFFALRQTAGTVSIVSAFDQTISP